MRQNALPCLLLSLSALTFLHAEDAAKPMGFRAEFLTQLDDVEKKIVSLAVAVPEEKYSWRPNEGVRSVGEVFVHVAFANYGIPAFLGMKPLTRMDREAETKITSKDKIVELLKESFENARKTALGTPDADLDKTVKSLGGKMVTKRSVLLLMATHMHEHLGQAIAYARMNNVIPPWSKGKSE
jgi:uncharacterized damage-inducible protein DinB